MEIIIFIIAIVVFITKMQKKAISQGKKADTNPPSHPPIRQQTVPNQSRRATIPNQSRPTAVPNQPRAEKTGVQLKEEIWSRLSEESKAKMLHRDTYQQMPLKDLLKNI